MSVEIDPRNQPDNGFLDSFGPHNPARKPDEEEQLESQEPDKNVFQDAIDEIFDRLA